jgi:hypothetical protein
MAIRASNHGSNYDVRVWLLGVPPLPPSFAAIVNTILGDRSTPVVNMLGVMFSEPYHIAHLQRILSQDVFNLIEGTN